MRDQAIVARLERIVIQRERSLFADDVQACRAAMGSLLNGSRCLVIGGGGSIGSSTIQSLAGFHPAAIHAVDLNENYLVELVRDLRGRPAGIGDIDLRTFPIDYGSPIMERLLAASAPYDVVLHFAALKHVRSEKDVYSLLQMIDTNIVRHLRFKQWVEKYGHGRRYFAVSTDKAANPTSAMGATKRLMEEVIFSGSGDGLCRTSARFANVAFSNGSLLQGFLMRLEKGQPLAVPKDTWRYFVSLREAGELCLLAALMLNDRAIAIPRMSASDHLQPMDRLACRIVEEFGFVPVLYEDEAEACGKVGELRARGQWPVLLTPRDTSGEKRAEEFVGRDEHAREIGLTSILAIDHVPSNAACVGIFDYLSHLVADTNTAIEKSDLLQRLSEVLPTMSHVETGRDLDQRL